MNEGTPTQLLSMHPSGPTRIEDFQNDLPKVEGRFERAPRPERRFEPPPLPRADGSARSRS